MDAVLNLSQTLHWVDGTVVDLVLVLVLLQTILLAAAEVGMVENVDILLMEKAVLFIAIQNFAQTLKIKL